LPDPSEEDEKKKLRAQRFGIELPVRENFSKENLNLIFFVKPSKEEEEKKKEARRQRFGDMPLSENEQKLKARLQRFGPTSTEGLGDPTKKIKS